MDNLKALDRAKDFAERVADKAVWSKVGEIFTHNNVLFCFVSFLFGASIASDLGLLSNANEMVTHALGSSRARVFASLSWPA